MIRILIADNQQLFRDLLEHMLKNNGEIGVVCSVKNGVEAVKAAKKYLPDVTIIDSMIPSGLDSIRKIKENGLETKILILTDSRDPHDVRTALKNGADGYILKSLGKNELIIAIKAVYYGLEVIDKNIRNAAYNPLCPVKKRVKNKSMLTINGIEVKLSDRELKIIKMIVEGMSNSDMAKELFITEGRLRNIITEILSKLMLKDRAQLAVFALRNGLV